MMVESNSADEVQWGHHPLISTVLWILGTGDDKSSGDLKRYVSHSPDVATEFSRSVHSSSAPSATTHRNSSSLTWKDLKTGGCIEEYFTQVQTQGSSTVIADAAADTNYSVAEQGVNENTTQLPRSNARHNAHACSDGGSTPSDVGSTVSPQWGFYVPITPPQPEMYSSSGSAGIAVVDSSTDITAPSSETAANTVANTWI